MRIVSREKQHFVGADLVQDRLRLALLRRIVEWLDGQADMLADQFARGSIELAYDEWHAPTVVTDPVDVTIDLTTRHRHVELVVRIGWNVTGAAPA